MVKKRPLLSIITVVKNGGIGFDRTLDSIMGQKNKSFQWLIKDGGSTDGTLEKALALKDERVLVMQGKDSGIYDAMNQAAGNISGQYVHFLNAGDFYASKNSIHQFSEAVKRGGFPPMVICFVKKQFSKTVVACPARPNRYYLYRRCFCHQAVFFHESLIPRVGCYDTSLRLKADHDLILKCLNRNHMPFVVPEDWVCYDGNGLTDNPKNFLQLDKETKVVHRRHFTVVERILFGAIQESTLWRIRRKLTKISHFSCVAAYNRVVSFMSRRL